MRCRGSAFTCPCVGGQGSKGPPSLANSCMFFNARLIIKQSALIEPSILVLSCQMCTGVTRVFSHLTGHHHHQQQQQLVPKQSRVCYIFMDVGLFIYFLFDLCAFCQTGYRPSHTDLGRRVTFVLDKYCVHLHL